MTRSGKTGRLVALLLAVASLVALSATPAFAGPTLNCVMSGKVVVAEAAGGGWDWSVLGAGPCLDLRFRGPYNAFASGTGHSDTLGFCDGLLVQNLSINVELTVVNLRTDKVRVTTETWEAPITTFPLATPFFVGGGQSGVGAIATRVLLNCPPAGTNGAVFVLNTTT